MEKWATKAKINITDTILVFLYTIYLNSHYMYTKFYAEKSLTKLFIGEKEKMDK